MSTGTATSPVVQQASRLPVAASSLPNDSTAKVAELIGVYNANGTVIGELTYLARSLLRGEHCSLCEITHGALREKAAWKACRQDLPVPFRTLHLNELTADLAAFCDDKAPCVFAVTTGGPVMLMADEDLARCAGSPERLMSETAAAVLEKGLFWP